jgi:histidyl-tRNA synthetase
MTRRLSVIEKIRSVFLTFGYSTIETPAMEYAATLMGSYGEEATEQIYRFRDEDGVDVALRYDHTVPFARFVAAHHKKLPMPFKRYQISPVWRSDRPARGRFREFIQCDIDIIGTRSLLAEGEIARVMTSVFDALGFERFVIKFNSRRLVKSVLGALGTPKEAQIAVIRILDGLSKVGLEEVAESLSTVLTTENVATLLKTLMGSGSTQEKMTRLNPYDIRDIEDFLRICSAFAIPNERLLFEPSLTRGLGYYTGMVFEVVLPGSDMGTLCAGGRYDDLCSMFSRERFSGVGVAFGFDRIMLAMEQANMEESKRKSTSSLTAWTPKPLTQKRRRSPLSSSAVRLKWSETRSSSG